MDNPIVAKVNLHSCNVRSKQGSMVVVKEKIQYADGTIAPNLALYHNPQRSFYITSPRYRQYRFKPDYELVSRCDKHTCCDHEMTMKLAAALDIRVNGNWIDPNKLLKSAYVFGADINIEALIKMRYADMYPDANLAPTTGFLDIETSIDTGQIILISYTHDDQVHTAALRSFCFREEGKNRIPVDEAYLMQHANEALANMTQGLTFKYNITILDTELQLIEWIFQRIHQAQVDFIGIWNMHYDLPKILSTIQATNSDAAAIFSDPKVPADKRYLKYYEDKHMVAHFTLKWHWLYGTCGSQFIDSMGLYTQCRRTAGFRARYTLDSILQDVVNIGKLPLVSGSHTIMQRHHFPDYVAYNIFDVVGMRLLENKNGDITAATVLAGPTPIAKFATQTTRATNNMYWNLIKKGQVLSSYSRESEHLKFNKLFASSGGSVLNPGYLVGCGVPLEL